MRKIRRTILAASGDDAGEEETDTSVNGTLQMLEDDMAKMTINTDGSDMVFYQIRQSTTSIGHDIA